MLDSNGNPNGERGRFGYDNQSKSYNFLTAQTQDKLDEKSDELKNKNQEQKLKDEEDAKRKAKKDWDNLTPQEQEQKKLEALDNFKKSDKLKENIKDAEEMRDKSRLEKYKWMYNNFKTGDKYDTKHGDPDKEHAGNFNYGAMGRAAGLSEQELERFAGAYQKYGESVRDILNWQIPDKLTGSTYRSEFGGPMDIGRSSYGDDPVDQVYIREGIEWYDEYY